MEDWIRYGVIVVGAVGVALGVIGFVMPEFRGFRNIRLPKLKLPELGRKPKREAGMDAMLREFRGTNFERVRLSPQTIGEAAALPDHEDEELDDLPPVKVVAVKPGQAPAPSLTGDLAEEEEEPQLVGVASALTESDSDDSLDSDQSSELEGELADPLAEPATDDPDGFLSFFSEAAATSTAPQALLNAIEEVSIADLLAQARGVHSLIRPPEQTSVA